MDLEWRALGAADAQQAEALIAAVEAVDEEGESFGAANWVDELSSPVVDARHGVFGAFAGEGHLVAFSMIYARTEADPAHEMHLWGAVHPAFRDRGIGTELLGRAIAAAKSISTLRFPGVPASLHCSVYDQLTSSKALFEENGFTPRQFEFSMERKLTAADAEAVPQPPAGYAFVGYGPESSEEFRAAHNASFALDHPGATAATPETWAAEVVEAESVRGDLSFGLRPQPAAPEQEQREQGGHIAGYLLCGQYDAGAETSGRRAVHVHYIGTRREHRGRGLASALIAAALHAAAVEGYDVASLGVLAENPTGALGVYKRAGFRVRRRFIEYARPL
jgi:ribosomal protein S18 acetylase RimI-like enzyme